MKLISTHHDIHFVYDQTLISNIHSIWTSVKHFAEGMIRQCAAYNVTGQRAKDVFVLRISDIGELSLVSLKSIP